jgi:hypothetical protein
MIRHHSDRAFKPIDLISFDFTQPELRECQEDSLQDTAPYSLVVVDGYFRGAYCLHHQGYHLQNRGRENLKTHSGFEVLYWFNLAQVRDRKRALVNTTMNLPVLCRGKNFLTS